MTAEYLYSTETGAINVDTEDLLDDVRTEFRNALGRSLNVDANTPQGTLIGAEVIARNAVMRNNAEYGNLINPNLSFGKFLDAICAFTDVDRGENRSTIVSGVYLEGNPNTSIAAESRVQTDGGKIFHLVENVEIGASGSVTVTIRSAEYGDIPAGPQALTIIDGTVGWGAARIIPSSVVSVGSVAMKDGRLKNARNKRLANQGIGSSAAIMAAVLAVPNVFSANVIENNTGETGEHYGIDFNYTSGMWVCVAGNPVAEEVAAALYRAHHGGCPWDFGGDGQGIPVNGGVEVADPSTGIRYLVKYTQAIDYDTYVNVIVKRGPSAANATLAIQNAIVAYADGNIDGESGFEVGQPVSAFDIAGAVSAQLPGLYIKSVKIACVLAGSPPPEPDDYTFEFITPMWGFPSTAAGNILVTVES